MDKKTGQVINKANTGNRKAFETQLNLAIQNKEKTSLKIEALNDSLTNLDIQILNMESNIQSGNELGAVKYVSELTELPIKTVANIFILLIIFVFDPLAIVLIIATNQSFKNIKPKPKKLSDELDELKILQDKYNAISNQIFTGTGGSL